METQTFPFFAHICLTIKIKARVACEEHSPGSHCDRSHHRQEFTDADSSTSLDAPYLPNPIHTS